MPAKFKQTVLALTCFAFSAAHADSVIKYEMSASDGAKEMLTISIVGRWLRLDSDKADKIDYTLMDTGRMLMFEVDDDAQSYRKIHMGRFYWPEDRQAKLKPEREKAVVSGLRCQKVTELGPDKPLAQHCMVPGQALGLNERKTKTLSRLFLVARRMGMNWGAVSTPDERQLSISSHTYASGKHLVFSSVEHKAIPNKFMKIPDNYQLISANKETINH